MFAHSKNESRIFNKKYIEIKSLNFEYLTDISKMSYLAFCIFESINNILYLVYYDYKETLCFYNILDDKIIFKIKLKKNGKKFFIVKIKHYLDNNNKRDLLLTIIKREIKIWNINNFECVFNLSKDCFLFHNLSACLLFDKNEIYIIIYITEMHGIQVYEPYFEQNKEVYNLQGKFIKK